MISGDAPGMRPGRPRQVAELRPLGRDDDGVRPDHGLRRVVDDVEAGHARRGVPAGGRVVAADGRAVGQQSASASRIAGESRMSSVPALKASPSSAIVRPSAPAQRACDPLREPVLCGQVRGRGRRRDVHRQAQGLAGDGERGQLLRAGSCHRTRSSAACTSARCAGRR